MAAAHRDAATTPSALRVRVGGAQATARGTLREGVYLLRPVRPPRRRFGISKDVREGGAEAHMLVVSARRRSPRERSGGVSIGASSTGY